MEKLYRGRFEEQFLLDEASVTLTFAEDASGALVLAIPEGVERINLDLSAEAYSNVKIFIQKEKDQEVFLDTKVEVFDDARIRLGVLDLSDGHFTFNLLGELFKQGATLEVYTAELCKESAQKKNSIKIRHHTDHTYGEMHNFSVVFDKGNYDMVADGTIAKGCPNSQSHQETRVLTMGTGHKVRVIPILYIDENEVKASHALTIGQPDEQQLYYLCSRGLSKQQAIGLLSIGYFMPVIDLIDDKDQHEKLREQMERKAGLYGH